MAEVTVNNQESDSDEEMLSEDEVLNDRTAPVRNNRKLLEEDDVSQLAYTQLDAENNESADKEESESSEEMPLKKKQESSSSSYSEDNSSDSSSSQSRTESKESSDYGRKT